MVIKTQNRHFAKRMEQSEQNNFIPWNFLKTTCRYNESNQLVADFHGNDVVVGRMDTPILLEQSFT